LFRTWRTTQKLVFLPFSALQKLLSTFWMIPCYFFTILMQNLMHTHCSFKSFSRYAKIVHATMHTCPYRDITQQSHVIQPFSKQEMSEQSVLYLHLVVEVVLAEVVSSRSQSRNYLFRPHISLMCNKHVHCLQRCTYMLEKGRGVDHPPSSTARVKERVELYLYSPLGLHGLF
jgi:hypothetical protein